MRPRALAGALLLSHVGPAALGQENFLRYAGRTPPLEVSEVNEDCAENWGGSTASRESRLKDLRMCCELDLFPCWDSVATFARCCQLVRGPESRLENISGVHLITYGSRHYARRALVLAEEARGTQWFDTVWVYTVDDLDAEFASAHRRFMRLKPRLGGYGIWKPQILLQRLRSLKEGEIVVYLDAGCEINALAGPRFSDYLRAAEQSHSGLFTFVTTLGPQSKYTKRDLAERLLPMFGAARLDEAMHAPQHITGMIWVRKSNESVAFLKQWRALMGSDYHFIDDSPSRTENFSDFVEHRHDQSVFSMLLYANGHRFFIRDESLIQPHQKPQAPIWASRLCGARHYLTASRGELEKAGCIEQPGYMPEWALLQAAAAAGAARAAA